MASYNVWGRTVVLVHNSTMIRDNHIRSSNFKIIDYIFFSLIATIKVKYSNDLSKFPKPIL